MARTKTTMVVEFQADKRKFEQQVNEMKSFELFKFDKKSEAGLKKMLAEQMQINEEVEMLQSSLRELEDFKGPEFDEMRKALEEEIERLTGEGPKSEKTKAVKDSIKSFFKDIKTKVLNGLKSIADDIVSQAKEMMDDIASYSEHSISFSQEATNLRLNYGLSGAQAYAFQKAAKESGFGDFETYLENAMFATQETLDDFDQMYELALKTYEQDEEIAVAYQHFQDAFSDFKTEMGMSLIDFFMQNKDTIMTLLQATVTILDGILQFVGWLVNMFNGGRNRTAYERQSALSDIYNSYGGSKTTNIKIDNSFQGISPNDRQTYANAGDMTYRQILAAFK